MGQSAIGTLIFIETDGRFATGSHDIGPSQQDLVRLMRKYGAVTAACLSGGSNCTMYAHGKILNHLQIDDEL
ncbi:phosphodiester glycosidase family protein [Alicyclobacillus acidiphilus]|uniref:phosphodiester glycosidase family protein n=1 Tax=Alicyclobacillus acidiphilus TaxID=182455 RepID=UPI0009FA15E1